MHRSDLHKQDGAAGRDGRILGVPYGPDFEAVADESPCPPRGLVPPLEGSCEPRFKRLALTLRLVAIMATGNKIRVVVRTAMSTGHDVIHLGRGLTAVHARVTIAVKDVSAFAFPRCVVDGLMLATSDVPAASVLGAIAGTTRY